MFDAHRADPQYNGSDWCDVGNNTDMVCDFARLRDINLCVISGMLKIKHIEVASDKFLTHFHWDGHSYCAASSQGHVQVARSTTLPARE